MAATVVPLLILAMAEVGLRVAGVGYPTDFFIKATIDGQAFWIENSKFGWRFFPRQMARTPTAQTLPLKKTEDTIRIFVFGESAAEGDPAPAYGFARILQVLLEERHPEKRFEVVNVAVTAINSHAIRSIARQSSRLEGDFWVVYAGHNEVIGSFGPATVFGAKPPSLGLIRAALFLKSTKIGQLVDQALQPSAAGEGWGGMEMFLDQQIHPDDPRLKAVYSNFQRNLEAIVRAGERSGARVLVSNMPGNLRDCAPFASLNAPGLAEPRLAAWKQLYERGVHLEEDRRMAEAIEAYLEAAEIDPTYAELQFRLGRCYLALNRPAQARDSFQRALDADTLRFRTDSRLNEIIAKVAERTGGVLVDSRQVLERESPDAIPGEAFFYEHVHLTFAGNYQLARTFAGEIARDALFESAPKAQDWPPASKCAELLAYTDWSQREIYQGLLRRMARPPFTHQLDHPAVMQRYQERLAQLNARMEPEQLREMEAVYLAALARSPSDHFLHEQSAAFLAEQGRFSEAIMHLEKVIELLPHYPRPYCALGNTLVELGRYDEAQARIQQALSLKPDFAEAFNGLGLVELYRGNYPQAAARFSQAIQKETDYLDAYYNRGIALTRQGDLEGAAASYRQALALWPDYAKAHTNLGNLLVRQRRFDQALEHLRTAVEVEPGRASNHNNLGTALAQSGKADEAIEHFGEAVRLQPDYLEARFNLGNAYAFTGRIDEAVIEWRAALEIQPDFVPALRALSNISQGRSRLPQPPLNE